jgi:hypothetical protein
MATMQPMNYTLNTANTGDAFDQGFSRQAGLMATVADYQKSQMMMQAQQQQMEQAAYKRQRLQEVASNPTIKNVQRLMIEVPEIHEALGKTLNSLSDGEKRATIASAHSVLSALKSGNQDAALAVIDKNIEAAKNSNRPDLLEMYQTNRDLVLADPKSAQLILTGNMYAAMGGKEFADATKTMDENERAKELQSSKVREAEAKAGKEETEAKYAGEKARTDIENTRSTIEDRKFDQRIKAMETQLKREDNALKREELQIKIDEAKAKRDETSRMKTAEADTAISSVRTTQALLSDVLGDEDTLRTATGAGAWRGSIPGTESRAMAGKLEQLQNALAAENLDRLKGAMSDKDIMFIKNISANLDRYQDEDKLISELKRVQRVLSDAEARTLKKYGKEDAPKEAAPTDALTRLKQKYGIQ